MWLGQPDAKLSTIYLIASGFTLLASPGGDERSAEAAGTARELDVVTQILAR